MLVFIRNRNRQKKRKRRQTGSEVATETDRSALKEASTYLLDASGLAGWQLDDCEQYLHSRRMARIRRSPPAMPVSRT